MVASSWFTAPLVAVALLFSLDAALAKKPTFRPPSLPTYDDDAACPERCSVSGPSTGNWSVYPNFEPIRKCTQTMFYDFSLYDSVDDPTVNHRIHACSSFGPDFSILPASITKTAYASPAPAKIRFDLGWWNRGYGLAAPGLRSLVKQLRAYIDHGHGDGAADRPFIIYGQSGQATIGLYIGQGLLSQGLSKSALKILQDNLANSDVSAPSLAIQLCGQGYGSSHIFGAMVTSNGTFAPIQEAIRTWANATCLSFAGSKEFPGEVMFTTPLLLANGTANSTVRARSLRPYAAECRTVQVEAGDSCGTLAKKCGISGADFTNYNPGASFCSTLKPKQHVCCSSGTLPDFRPVTNPDGSCYSYKVKSNDNCADLAAEYGLTVDEIESFNKNTWGWGGCKVLFLDTIMCLSKGAPPFPAPISNAICGPQKLGTIPPTDGSNIADLNPCPINACCNIWGQCGISKDFCIDTNTGPPGTAAPGTYGCISNCGLDIVKGKGTGSIKIAYFEGFGLERECLFQDASQIDTSKYTHVHFAFGTLTPTYEVNVGDILSSYQFTQFKLISGPKKILSFGGWDFSTSKATYSIFPSPISFIWNSMVKIHAMYHDYVLMLERATSLVSVALDDMQKTFAPVPVEEDKAWLYLLIDLITLGTLAVAGPLYNRQLGMFVYFSDKSVDDIKDTTMTLIGQSTTIAKDVLSTKQEAWTANLQASFNNMLSRVIEGHAPTGKRGPPDPGNIHNELQANVKKSIYAFAIPNLWGVSQTFAFILDSGFGCDVEKPLQDYLEDETMEATGACVDGKRYYLVAPIGESRTCDWVNGMWDCTLPNKFSAPPGLERLGADFGYLTKEDFIKGSIRTWLKNGKRNAGGGMPDVTDIDTINSLIDLDFTTPGFIHLPVCSPERAYQSWDTSSSGYGANYPCDPPPGINNCGDSTFEDQTSAASPRVEDCLQIIKNIQDDGKTEWTIQVLGKNQREIAKFGECRFGVEATEQTGNADFKVGGQDVIDIINDAVKKFGGSGRVGAKGDMSCNGNIKGQAVKWGIY
ncbi:uncharacterized protein P884DRAFT_273605 [Thermothelomyces heterothallicus CBS 202.75]|uniref:uncharacterized protein n=1 Tax=Thermothelomyces heterothallicus CBS 202.75 TaxID=1149848 RepID=UPI003743D094